MKGLVYLVMELEALEGIEKSGKAKEILRTVEIYYRRGWINTDVYQKTVGYVEDFVEISDE